MLNGWDGVLGVQVGFFPSKHAESSWCPKAQFSSHLTTALSPRPFSESSRCLFANFRWACTCAFLRRGTLRALTDFSPLRYNVLLMVILVTVVPAALRSSTSSCYAVLGCSFTFLIIRFTPHLEILCGAPNQGWLIVNWCFFHFLIIAPAVDSSSPSCLPIVLKPIPVLCSYKIPSQMFFDNSYVLPIAERLDSDSLKDSMK